MWSAERMYQEFPEFCVEPNLSQGRPLLFTGEMIFSWMFSDYAMMSPMKDAAQILASKGEKPNTG